MQLDRLSHELETLNVYKVSLFVHALHMMECLMAGRMGKKLLGNRCGCIAIVRMNVALNVVYCDIDLFWVETLKQKLVTEAALMLGNDTPHKPIELAKPVVYRPLTGFSANIHISMMRQISQNVKKKMHSHKYAILFANLEITLVHHGN